MTDITRDFWMARGVEEDLAAKLSRYGIHNEQGLVRVLVQTHPGCEEIGRADVPRLREIALAFLHNALPEH